MDHNILPILAAGIRRPAPKELFADPMVLLYV
jgi:hypothetical protein